MDNLGDWLYIVFLLIAVVSGLFSGKKKKQPTVKPVQSREQTETSSGTDKGKGFWEILEEMQKGPQQTKPRPKKATTTPFLSGESIRESTIPKQNSILLEEEYEADHRVTNDDFHLQDVDEVRKAIIYSEILNRRL